MTELTEHKRCEFCSNGEIVIHPNEMPCLSNVCQSIVDGVDSLLKDELNESVVALQKEFEESTAPMEEMCKPIVDAIDIFLKNELNDVSTNVDHKSCFKFADSYGMVFVSPVDRQSETDALIRKICSRIEQKVRQNNVSLMSYVRLFAEQMEESIVFTVRYLAISK